MGTNERICAKSWEGATRVAEAVVVQLLASVTVTVWVPACNPDLVAADPPPFHK